MGATGNVRRATRQAAFAGQTFAWILIIWGMLQFFSHNWVGGIWSVLIGMFLNSAAKSGYQQVLIRQALQGESVRRFMNPDPIVVSPALDLLSWVEDFVYHYHHHAFPVISDGELVGNRHDPGPEPDSESDMGRAHGWRSDDPRRWPRERYSGRRRS